MSAKGWLFVLLAGFTLFYLRVLWAGFRKKGELGAASKSLLPVLGGSFLVSASLLLVGWGVVRLGPRLGPVLSVLLLIGACVAAFGLLLWLRERGEPSLQGGIGAFTNFFDTLGIGSFATTTALFKLWKLVEDRVIPGTLNVGHTLPTAAQAFIYIAIVEVDFKTLAIMIAGSVLGAWLGAGIVASWPRRKVQIGMGGALLVAAALMFITAAQATFGWTILPVGGDTLDLQGARLWIGFLGNLALGALMTLGIGLYAPCLILVSLLGMNPKAAFPIMMGSCAFLMPVGSAKFIKEEAYDPRAALGLALGGIPAVLVAAYIVKSLPLTAVRWLVVVVVLYTAFAMLRSAMKESRAA